MEKEGPLGGPKGLLRVFIILFVAGIFLSLISAGLIQYSVAPAVLNLGVGFIGILLIAVSTPVIGSITD